MENRTYTVSISDTALLVVLGMHRSGTSVITRAMQTMGAEFGDNLMPPVAGVNDKGFFEDLDIYAINAELMKTVNADWHSLAPIEVDHIPKSQFAALQDRALELLSRKIVGKKVYALKDPRIARLLPFWQPIFDRLSARVVYIIAIRNPVSVSRSLEKRDQFADEKSFLLWLVHTVPALRATQGLPRALIDYDRLLEAPRSELQRLASKLALPLDPQRLSEFENDFIDNRLRHTRFEASDLENTQSAPRQVKELFAALRLAATSSDERDSAVSETVLCQAQRYLDDVAPVLRYQWRIERKLSELTMEVATDRERIDALQQALDESESRAHELSALAQNFRAMLEQANDAPKPVLQRIFRCISAPLRIARRHISATREP